MAFVLLKRVDVIILEELGQFCEEYIAAMSEVSQWVMDKDLPFGGKLVIANGDHRQLKEVQGSGYWLSPQFLTCFKVALMQYLVRSANDLDLQLVVNIARLCTEERFDEIRKFLDIIIRRCLPNAVADWHLVPENATRVVGTRQAERNAMERFLQQKQADPTVRCVTYDAVDEVQSAGRSWRPATRDETARLTRAVDEYEHCTLFVGATVCMTFNLRQGDRVIFSRGQLAVVRELPDKTLRRNDQKLRLTLVPIGRSNWNAADLDGWETRNVGYYHPPQPSYIGRGQVGRREQFPVRMNISNTVSFPMVGSDSENMVRYSTVQSTELYNNMYIIFRYIK